MFEGAPRLMVYRESWGASCGVLEPLGVSWWRLGCLRALLGLGGRLGGVLGSLGASWGRVLEASSDVLKRFHDVQTEWSDGFNLVGRAQRASERSERSERSVEKILRCTSGPKGLCQRELDPYVFEGLGYSPEDVAKRSKRSIF